MTMHSSNTPATLELLIAKNQEFLEQYKASAFVQLASSFVITTEKNREEFLGFIQTISNYFQKVVLLRSAFTNDLAHYTCALEHMKEEFCHNEELMKIRNNKPATWDPIVESTCSWFAWKMFNSNDEEKIVLIHLILEASANIFFRTVQQALEKNDVVLNYFAVHSDVDDKHESMGLELLKDLTPKTYAKLIETQSQGWSIFIAACDRIASLMPNKASHASVAALVV